MTTIQLGALMLQGEREDRGDLIAITFFTVSGEQLSTLRVAFATWQSLVSLATVLDAAHRTLEANVEEIRRLDFALAHERQQVAKMKPVYEAAVEWLDDRRYLAQKKEDMNERLRRGETVTMTVGGYKIHPDNELTAAIEKSLEESKRHG